MNNRTRGGLGIDNNDKGPDNQTTDYTNFKPRSQPHATSAEPVKHTAEEAGFTTRHAAPPPAKIDGRSLRSSNRTAQLNIAVRPETRDRFWRLAQAAGLQTGEDFLNRLMDGLSGGR
jgi:hypothetical protein